MPQIQPIQPVTTALLPTPGVACLPAAPTSVIDFQRLFPDDEACAHYLECLRWPAGFTCPYCGVQGEPFRFANLPTRLRCRACERNTQITAGTIMHRSKQPLRFWMWAAYFMTSETPGMSALQFQRQLGIKRYETAFMLLHKMRASMVRPDRDPIGAKWPVELDETLVGGRTKGEGRGRHHKVWVAGAVEVRTLMKGEPLPYPEPLGPPKKRRVYAGRLRMRLIPERRTRYLEPFTTENVTKGATIRTDGFTGYDGLIKLGYSHEVNIPPEDAPPDAEVRLPMIHLMFSNLKTWLLGTHHGVSNQHLQAYLNEFVFRFNRRWWPMTAFHAALGIGTTAHAPTYEALYSGGYAHPNPTDLR